MMHDERFRRKSAAGAATALSLLMLAVAVPSLLSGHCAGRAIRQSLRHSRNDRAGVARPEKPMTPIRHRRTSGAICRSMGAPAADPNAARPWRREAPGGPVSPPSGYDSGRGPGPSASPQNAVVRGVIPETVEKGDLAPVMSNDGSGLPYELWRRGATSQRWRN